MAIVFGGVATGGGFPPTTVSFPLGISAGSERTMLLGIMTVGGGAAPVFSNVRYDGVLGTQIATAFATIFGRVIATTVFEWLNADLPVLTGGYSVTYTATGPYDSRAAALWYDGAVQSLATPIVTLTGQNNPPLSGIQSINVNGIAPSGLVLDFFGAEPSAGPITCTPGASQVERADLSDLDTLLACSDKPYSGAPVVNMTQTPSGSYFAFSYLGFALPEFGTAPDRSSFLLGTQA